MTICPISFAPVITLRGIGKKYQFTKSTGRNTDIDLVNLWALKDVSLDVHRGEILGIIGRNGAGKTTLLNIISGVLSPTKGKMEANGRVLGLFNLGVGFQDELTGRENIFLNGALIGAARKELENKLDSIIDFSELGNFIDMPLGSYSQGMRLRLAFSIMVNLEFDILAIDEVLAVGDALFQSKCFQRLAEFRREGKTMVITTQDMLLIERFCDRVALLNHGLLVFSGEAKEGVNTYYSILNTEKFFVAPMENKAKLIESTKKWSEDVCNWGKQLGTNEVAIDSARFTNRFGFISNKIKTGGYLKIRVRFNALNVVKNPHFGIAIFR
jgi:ABC-type polysaccharide/polyol phosphate transport system ATPase subunit